MILSLIVIACGLFLVSNTQIISKRAYDLNSDELSHLAGGMSEEKRLELLSKVNPKAVPIKYSSPIYGYNFEISGSIWQIDENKLTGDTNNWIFDLNKGYGRARVSFTVSETGVVESMLEEYRDLSESGADKLDVVTQALVDAVKKENDAERYEIKRERIQRNGVDFNLVTIGENRETGNTEYDMYIAEKGGRYYWFTLKYPRIGNSGIEAERLVDLVKVGEEKVQGATTEEEMDLNETQISELSNPSVINILHLSCFKLAGKSGVGFQYVKDYRFCTGGMGTGFFVNSDGLLATNGHVVKIFPEEAVVQGILGGDLIQYMIDLIRDSMLAMGKEVSQTEAIILIQDALSNNPQIINAFLEDTYRLMDKGLLLATNDETEYFVRMGDQSFEINSMLFKPGLIKNAVKKSDGIYRASLVKTEYQNSLSPDVILRKKEVGGVDLALMKIDDETGIKSYPALRLQRGEGGIKEGGRLLVIGYPGLVSGQDGDSGSSILDYKKASVKATLTRGIVSAIKPSKSGVKLIQTDASVEHGNSGGPGFDSTGQVIGVATYGLESKSGSYNFLIGVEELEKMMVSNSFENMTEGTYDNWRTGLEYYWGSQYKKAVKNFAVVKESYPSHPEVNNYLANAEKYIAEGKDKSGFFYDREWMIYAIIGGVVVLVVGAVAVVIKTKKTKGGGGSIAGGITTQQPVSTPAPGQEPGETQS